MSIIVKGLTKIFGNQTAVNKLDFSIRPGEIVGFLGPNGAGKSTTMKMLCCYLTPDEGTAEVAGFDIQQQSLDVRRNIGYLPEHNPLYEEMYVREYLAFVARIHGLPNAEARIREVVYMTGLEKEQHKIIGTLSKGYRQRVGLAQAIIHDPKVLILDEPTSGLDMNQLVEVRQLIKDLGKEKTLIFSSHIMQEIQALCQRVIIIHDGNLVADDPIEKLQSGLAGMQQIVVEFAEADIPVAVFKAIRGVNDAVLNGKVLTIRSKDPNEVKAEIFKAAVENKITIVEMKTESADMETVFRQLTKNIS